ncbi:MAG TPA: hypothetical protein VL285_16210 [Bryobacteraceae bacterium]|nr:hypothetical protein [Bryobacteraceae bacterium]
MPSIGSVTLGDISGRPEALTTRAQGRGFSRFVIPDLALVASLVTLFYCLFLFAGYGKLFRDSDAGWHIRTGESILSTRELPTTDPYSFTRQGRPWFAWEWGSDALTGVAYRAAGLSGVAWLYGMVIAAGVWFWFRLTWLVGGDFLIACLLAAPLLSTTNIHWLARPHVLSWLLFLAALAGAELASGRPVRPRHTLAVAALTALWANLHASFFFAPLICLIYGAGHALRPVIWDLDRREEWRKARWFGLAATVSAAASLVNPYGWQLHRHLFDYLTDAELMARIGEFQSFNFHAEGAFQIVLTLGIAMLGAALALGQKQLGRFLLAAALIYAALRSARGLPLVALALLPMANAGIAKGLAAASGLRPTVRRAIQSFLAYSAGLRAHDSRFSGLALAPVFAILMFGMLRAPGIAAHTGFPPDQFPVAAAAEVDRLPASARILAPDKFGGYLIYRFEGRRKVFFDGRSDLYGSDFLKQYARLTQLRPGWRAQLDEFGFTHALLPNDYSLLPALEALGWKQLYRDGTATLLAR